MCESIAYRFVIPAKAGIQAVIELTKNSEIRIILIKGVVEFLKILMYNIKIQ